MSDRARRGSILVAVLWSLFFLAALALVLNASITPQLGLAARLRDRAVLHYLAQAGVQRAVLTVKLDETIGYDALNEPWSRNEEAFEKVSLADGSYFSLEIVPDGAEESDGGGERYGLTDEERKININAAPAEVLKNFFETVGEASMQEAADIADAVIDWRDEDDDVSDRGAENSYYQGLAEGYPCKNGHFEVPEELRLVKGVTQNIYDKIKGRFTVYGPGPVNINTADALVLQSLGMDAGLAEKIVLLRRGNDGQEATEDDNIFEEAGSVIARLSSVRGVSPAEGDELNAILEAGLIGVRSDNFRGEAVARFTDGTTAARIVFVINRNGTVRYWREG